MNLHIDDLKNTFIALLSGVLLTVMLKINVCGMVHQTDAGTNLINHLCGLIDR